MLLKKAYFLILSVLLLFAALQYSTEGRNTEVHTVVAASAEFQNHILIIDAGHGGEDGGAVSLSGVSESSINLSVAQRLDAILGLYGVQTMLTRSEDRSLHDESARTLREKKVSDLRNRVSMIEEQERAVLISIHQNSYPDRRYHGAQVFFADSEGSEVLAQSIQSSLISALDPENRRQPKKIPDNIYLMNHISCCAVLVECGFLTNPMEEQQLLNSAYQTKLATALAGGYLLFQSGLV